MSQLTGCHGFDSHDFRDRRDKQKGAMVEALRAAVITPEYTRLRQGDFQDWTKFDYRKRARSKMLFEMSRNIIGRH